MAKVTIQAKLVEMLLAEGCTEVASKSSKYRQFITPTSSISFYWVGKAGALRFGPKVTGSVTRERTKTTLLAKWDAIHTVKTEDSHA